MSGVSGTSSIFSSPCSSPVDNGGHSLLDNSNNGLLSTKELHGFVTATSTRRDSRPTTRPASLYWGSPSPSVDKTVQRSSRGQHSQRPGTRRALQVERMSKLSSTQTRTSFAVGLPYYAPTPKQSAAMADRRDIYSRKRDQARMQGIERGEPWRRRKQTQDALASQIAYESHHSAVAAERGDIRFLPSLPQAVDLARGTWAWDEAHETPAAREAAVASVRVLRDDPAATLKILAAWKAPSMSKQLAARFKELKLGNVGRDPSKSLMKSLGRQQKELMEAEAKLPAQEQQERAEAVTKVQAKARGAQARAEVEVKRELKRNS